MNFENQERFNSDRNNKFRKGNINENEENDRFEHEESVLILGGYPSERLRGRSLYSSDRYIILDDIPLRDTDSDFRSRYIKANFNNSTQLRLLARAYPQRFSKIMFDWSTYKFFQKDNTYQLRLNAILKMLMGGGKLFIDSPEGSEFVYELTNNTEEKQQRRKQEIMTRNRQLITSTLQSFGCITEEKNISTILDDPDVDAVYKTSTPSLNVMIATKPLRARRRRVPFRMRRPTRGGRTHTKRKQQGKYRKTRKSIR